MDVFKILLLFIVFLLQCFNKKRLVKGANMKAISRVVNIALLAGVAAFGSLALAPSAFATNTARILY